MFLIPYFKMIAFFIDTHIKKINFVFDLRVGIVQNRQIAYSAITALMLFCNFIFRRFFFLNDGQPQLCHIFRQQV